MSYTERATTRTQCRKLTKLEAESSFPQRPRLDISRSGRQVHPNGAIPV